jgi:hypothetical protein
MAYRAAGTLHLLEGDWAMACSLIEHWIAVARSVSFKLSKTLLLATAPPRPE